MSYSIIAAIGKNNELGKNNDLIWHLKGDMKFFKEKTMNHKIIMGRKTFESLPKMLPNRDHIVLSSSNNFPSNVEVFSNIDELLKKYNDYNQEIFIIGGASIYKLFLDKCDKLYLTNIDAIDNEATAYFPNFDKSLYDSILLDENNTDKIKYNHVLYKRKK